MQNAQIAIDNDNLNRASEILRMHYYYQPNDDEERFLLARVLSWQGEWDESLKHFNALLKEKPNNTDFLLARANTFKWMGDRQAALKDIELVREISPDNIELWRSELKLLSRNDDVDRQRQKIVLASLANKHFPNQIWDDGSPLVTEKEIANNQYAIEANYGYSQVSNKQPSWKSASVNLSMHTPVKHFANIALDKKQRFNLNDWQVGGSYALPYNDEWRYYLASTYSSTHKFLAHWMVDARVTKQLMSGLSIDVGLRESEYTDTNSEQVYLTGEYYWSSYRFAYTYKHIHVNNAGNGFNHKLQFNRYYSPESMIGALVATGEDVEFDGTSNPPISNVLTLSLFGQHNIQPHWWFNYAFNYHEQGDFYTLNGITLGIKHDY